MNPGDLSITKHAQRRMRLYHVAAPDIAYLLDRPQSLTPSRRRTDRVEAIGEVPDGRRFLVVMPAADPITVITLYPLRSRSEGEVP